MIAKGACPPFDKTFEIGDKLVCPVCGKEFIADENTVYATTKGFTCSWKCFINRVNACEKKKHEEDSSYDFKEIILKEEKKSIEENPPSKKRGRPKKMQLF